MENRGGTHRAPRPTRFFSNGHPSTSPWSEREWVHTGGFFPIHDTSSPQHHAPQEHSRQEWSSPEIEPRRGVDTQFVHTEEDSQEDSDDSMGPAEPRSSEASTPASGSPDRTRRSRYLREADRHAIIQRIADGEKQAELAREFGVTRAAICHINKNRAEILARSSRPDVHAAARHPKRRMSMAALSQRQQRARERHHHQSQHGGKAYSPETEPFPSCVYQVRSHALELHMAALRRQDTGSVAFRSIANRAIWILLEEALATAPTRHVDVVAPDESVWPGLAHTNPACAMVLSESGYPMLEAFRTLQPDSPTGSITLAYDTTNQHDDAPPVLRKMNAPLQLRGHDVFLLDASCTRARDMCVAIQSLLDFGAVESSVCVATLELGAAAADEIHARYPQVRLVTAAVADDGRRSGPLGDFLERYFNTTTVHTSAHGANADV